MQIRYPVASTRPNSIMSFEDDVCKFKAFSNASIWFSNSANAVPVYSCKNRYISINFTSVNS